MKQMQMIYEGELRTKGKHLKSGDEIITDAPTDNHGKGQAYSPTDLLCSSLCACMMTLMGIYANKEGIDISGMTADITKIMNDKPRKVKEVQIDFTISKLQASERHIKGLKVVAKTCPVAMSLSDELKQTITFNF